MTSSVLHSVLEYDYTTNTFTQVTSVLPIIGADSVAGVPCNFSNMLDLPNGQVMFSISQENVNQYWFIPRAAAQFHKGYLPLTVYIQLRVGL